jgi:hypothetical protein
VDEINKERHTRMNFCEFVEAICRVADRAIDNLSKGADEEVQSSARSIGSTNAAAPMA